MRLLYSLQFFFLYLIPSTNFNFISINVHPICNIGWLLFYCHEKVERSPIESYIFRFTLITRELKGRYYIVSKQNVYIALFMINNKQIDIDLCRCVNNTKWEYHKLHSNHVLISWFEMYIFLLKPSWYLHQNCSHFL